MKSWFSAGLAALAGALAAGALSASAAQFGVNNGGGVSKAEFQRLQGQVQALEGRVAALERISGHSGGGKGGKTAHDSWNGH
jgi:hypothetical protein